MAIAPEAPVARTPSCFKRSTPMAVFKRASRGRSASREGATMMGELAQVVGRKRDFNETMRALSEVALARECA
jgi:hypothetical protein